MRRLLPFLPAPRWFWCSRHIALAIINQDTGSSMKTYDIDNYMGKKRFGNSLFIALKENILGRIMTSMFSVIYLTLLCLLKK